MEKAILNIIDRVVPLDKNAMEGARMRQSILAKPPGSLGLLEDLSIQIAGITGKVLNKIDKKCVVILSADNGVRKEGVASAPKWITTAQTINFTRRITGVGALAKNLDTDLLVVDVGIDNQLPKELVSKDPADMIKNKIIDRKIAYGTRNLHIEPAMTRTQALEAINVGIEMADHLKESGYKLIGVGEMGIGNTTTSAAVLASLLRLSSEEVVGRGGGLNDEFYEKKKRVVAQAASQSFIDEIDILSKVGGFDIGAMTGVFLGAAANSIPVVIDGYISSVAALLAYRLVPKSREYMFASHKSCEIGYGKAITALGLSPLFDLKMRLGEGSGCPIAFQIIEAALAAMRDMGTFEEAEINDEYLNELREGDCF